MGPSNTPLNLGYAPAPRRAGLARGLRIFAIAIIAVLLAIAALSVFRQAESRIGSEQYREILQAREIVGDILPPTSFVIEAYLSVLAASQDPQRRDAHFGDYRAHKEAYFRQLESWKAANLPHRLKSLLTVESPTILDRFWIEAETNFFPALEGARPGGNAVAGSLETLARRFAEHRAITERAAAEAESLFRAAETRSVSGTRVLDWAFYALLGFGLLLVASFLVMASRGVIRPMRQLIDHASSQARGAANGNVPHVERTDEIGAIARALAVFQEDVATKTQAEKNASEELERDAKERAEADARLAARAEETARAVERLGGALNQFAQGDLTCRIETPLTDDLERVRADFNGAIEQLADTFRQIAFGANSIESGTREINVASGDLSSRTERQATALEQTAAALSQITSTIKTSSEAAENTRRIVHEARQDAETSGEVVEKALSAMSDIEKSAGEISQIITVIDDIAFQTNLLALNAGVEAARAGAAGQGFAVVASEVRALAQRSATAAQEIKQLIAKSNGQVSNGSQMVKGTGEALNRIAGRVLEISGMVDQIANGTTEQSVALSQLNDTVGDMDQVTQQNAAMAEQAAAASHSLSQESETLARLIAMFDLGETHRRAEPAAIPPHANRNAGDRAGSAAQTRRVPRGRTYGNAALKDTWEEF